MSSIHLDFFYKIKDMFTDIFNELLKENDLTRSKFATMSGIPYSTIVGWTSLGRLPDFLALTKIADFFHCSIDYLAGRKDEWGNNADDIIPDSEVRLLKSYRKLDMESRELVCSLCEKLNKRR